MIRISNGEKLPFTQSQIQTKGWAIEARVCAEDPGTFLPAIGKLVKYLEPKSHNGSIRCDTGLVQGSSVTIHYDPLLCKVVAYAPTRDQAIQEMKYALDRYLITGVQTNVSLLCDIFNNPRFQSGKLSTAFLAQEYPSGFAYRPDERSRAQLAILSAFIYFCNENRNAPKRALKICRPVYIKINNSAPLHVNVSWDDDKLSLTHKELEYHVETKWQPGQVYIEAALNSKAGASNVAMICAATKPLGFSLVNHGVPFDVTVLTEAQFKLLPYIKEKKVVDQEFLVVSPMPGLILSVAVEKGQIVEHGQELAVIEAMKMQVIH